MSNTNENTPKRNSIKSTEKGVNVTLDPSFLLKHTPIRFEDGKFLVSFVERIEKLII